MLPQNFFDIDMKSYDKELFEKEVNYLLSDSDYSQEEKGLIKEILVAEYMIIPGLFDGSSYFEVALQIKGIYSIPDKIESFIGDLVEETDSLEHEFKFIYKCLQESRDYKKFDIIQEFILSQLDYYDKYELSDIIHEQHYNYNMRFTGKKRAKAFRALLDHKDIDSIEFECTEFLKEYRVADIIEYLDNYIVGQEEAKRAAANLLYRHAQKIKLHDTSIKKGTICL